MAKKEKTIELKAKAEKISEEHLKELQTVVNRINNLQYNIGKIEANKHKALHDLAMYNDQVGLLQDKLQKEYGTFDVNVTDGTINWPKENKEDKDEK